MRWSWPVRRPSRPAGGRIRSGSWPWPTTEPTTWCSTGSPRRSSGGAIRAAWATSSSPRASPTAAARTPCGRWRVSRSCPASRRIRARSCWSTAGRDVAMRPGERRFLAMARRGRLVTLPGAYHLSSLDRPAEFTAVIRSVCRSGRGARRQRGRGRQTGPTFASVVVSRVGPERPDLGRGPRQACRIGQDFEPTARPAQFWALHRRLFAQYVHRRAVRTPAIAVASRARHRPRTAAAYMLG